MFSETNHLLKNFQIRKSAAQKADFRDWLRGVLTAAGYESRVEVGGLFVKSSNVVVGDPEKARVVYTAHYDTCAVLPFPNFITPRNFFLYLLSAADLCPYICPSAWCRDPLIVSLGGLPHLAGYGRGLRRVGFLHLVDHGWPGQQTHSQRQHLRRGNVAGDCTLSSEKGP